MSLSRLASVSAYSTSVSASVSTISSRPAPNDPSASVGGTDEGDARISLLSSSPLPEVAAVKKAKRAMAANTSSPKTATSPPDTSQLGSIDNTPKPASPAATRSESTAPPPPKRRHRPAGRHLFHQRQQSYCRRRPRRPPQPRPPLRRIPPQPAIQAPPSLLPSQVLRPRLLTPPRQTSLPLSQPRPPPCSPPLQSPPEPRPPSWWKPKSQSRCLQS